MPEATVRPERPGDEQQIAEVLAAAFRRSENPHSEPPEVRLVEELRTSSAWIAPLSLVAVDAGATGIVGHVVCTRGTIDGFAVLALGPLGVAPSHQGRGIGSSLMQAVIVAAGLHGEAVICLLGDPGFYSRFGFVPATSLGIEPPEPAWGDYFQALVAPGTEVPQGRFSYPEPFSGLG